MTSLSIFPWWLEHTLHELVLFFLCARPVLKNNLNTSVSHSVELGDTVVYFQWIPHTPSCCCQFSHCCFSQIKAVSENSPWQKKERSTLSCNYWDFRFTDGFRKRRYGHRNCPIKVTIALILVAYTAILIILDLSAPFDPFKTWVTIKNSALNCFHSYTHVGTF